MADAVVIQFEGPEPHFDREQCLEALGRALSANGEIVRSALYANTEALRAALEFIVDGDCEDPCAEGGDE